VHVAGGAGDCKRFAAVVALDERDVFGRAAVFIEQAAGAQAGLQAERDFGLHVGEFFLDELVVRERAAELLARERVVARGMPAKLGRAERAPSDAVSRLVQAVERAGKAARAGQQVFLRHEHFFQHDFAGRRCAQTHLAADCRCAEAVHAALDDKAADDAVQFRPDHGEVGDRGVGDPGFVAVQVIAAAGFFGARAHAAGVGAVPRLGQAEAADGLAARQRRQKFLFLLLAAVCKNRMHDQR